MNVLLLYLVVSSELVRLTHAVKPPVVKREEGFPSAEDAEKELEAQEEIYHSMSWTPVGKELTASFKENVEEYFKMKYEAYPEKLDPSDFERASKSRGVDMKIPWVENKRESRGTTVEKNLANVEDSKMGQGLNEKSSGFFKKRFNKFQDFKAQIDQDARTEAAKKILEKQEAEDLEKQSKLGKGATGGSLDVKDAKAPKELKGNGASGTDPPKDKPNRSGKSYYASKLHETADFAGKTLARFANVKAKGEIIKKWIDLDWKKLSTEDKVKTVFQGINDAKGIVDHIAKEVGEFKEMWQKACDTNICDKLKEYVGKMGEKLKTAIQSMARTKLGTFMRSMAKNVKDMTKKITFKVKTSALVMKGATQKLRIIGNVAAKVMGIASAALAVAAAGFEVYTLVSDHNSEAASAHEQTMQKMNKMIDGINEINTKLETMQKNVIAAVSRIEQVLQETEEELKDHLMYALAFSSIRETVIEISSIGTMIKLKTMEKQNEDIKAVCQNHNPHYLTVQLAEKIKAPVGVEGITVMEAYIRLRDVTYNNAEAFVDFGAQSLMQGMTITSECYGIMLTEKNDAAKRLAMLGMKTSEVVRFLYQTLYDGFEKYTYKLGKPIMSDGLATIYEKSAFDQGIAMPKETFAQGQKNDNDFMVKLTTNFHPVSTTEDTDERQAYRPDPRCRGSMGNYGVATLSCDNKDKKDLCGVNEFNKINRAPLNIDFRATVNNGKGATITMGQEIRSDMHPYEAGLLANTTQPYRRGYLRTGDLLYNGAVEFTLDGRNSDHSEAYKSLRFKQYLEIDYSVSYRIWLWANCGAEYKTASSGEGMGKKGDNIYCQMNPANSKGQKLYLGPMIHNSSTYMLKKVDDEFSEVARSTFLKYYSNFTGIERFDASAKALREKTVFDDEAKANFQDSYGTVYDEIERFEYARRMRVIALAVGLSLGCLVLFAGLVVALLVFVIRRRERKNEDFERTEETSMSVSAQTSTHSNAFPETAQLVKKAISKEGNVGSPLNTMKPELGKAKQRKTNQTKETKPKKVKPKKAQLVKKTSSVTFSSNRLHVPSALKPKKVKKTKERSQSVSASRSESRQSTTEQSPSAKFSSRRAMKKLKQKQ